MRAKEALRSSSNSSGVASSRLQAPPNKSNQTSRRYHRKPHLEPVRLNLRNNQVSKIILLENHEVCQEPDYSNDHPLAELSLLACYCSKVTKNGCGLGMVTQVRYTPIEESASAPVCLDLMGFPPPPPLSYPQCHH